MRAEIVHERHEAGAEQDAIFRRREQGLFEHLAAELAAAGHTVEWRQLQQAFRATRVALALEAHVLELPTCWLCGGIGALVLDGGYEDPRTRKWVERESGSATCRACMGTGFASEATR